MGKDEVQTIILQKTVIILCPEFQQLVLNMQRAVTSTAQGNFVSLHFK